VRETLTIRVVPLKEVITPSMKFEGEAVLPIRTRSDTAKAVAVEARLVVNVLEPVVIVDEVELVRPE
jgi:hypothetical protein